MEVVAWPVWLLQEALILFDGGARRSSTAGRFHRCARGGPLGPAGAFPLPYLDAADPGLENKRKVMCWSRSTARATQGGGSSELSSGVSPSAWGLRPFQGQRGEGAAAMHWHVMFVAGSVV